MSRKVNRCRHKLRQCSHCITFFDGCVDMSSLKQCLHARLDQSIQVDIACTSLFLVSLRILISHVMAGRCSQFKKTRWIVGTDLGRETICRRDLLLARLGWRSTELGSARTNTRWNPGSDAFFFSFLEDFALLYGK
jgi:hypothetical protein